MEIGSIIGLVINGVIAVFVAMLRGAMKRIADDLDRRMADQDKRIDGHDAGLKQVAADLRVEAEARHAAVRAEGDRLWQVNADLKENYPSRRETMKQYGTLVQQLGKIHEDLGGKIDQLPCHQVGCPAPGSGDAP